MMRRVPTLPRSASARWILLGALLVVGLPALLALSRPMSPASRAASPPYLTIFLIDGLSQAVFEAELAAGALPNLGRLIDEGLYVRNGISAFPSMTGYGYYPFLTGMDAARSGILGLRWFDRELPRGNFRNYVGRTNIQMNHDIRPEHRLLFEHFPAEPSTSINSYMDRGARASPTMGLEFTLAKYRERLFFTKPLIGLTLRGHNVVPTLLDFEENTLRLALKELRARPKIQWITFVSPDASQHVSGLNAEYVRLIREIDRLIGLYRAESARLGLEEGRIYAAITDHGVTDVRWNLDLGEALFEPLGLRTTRRSSGELATDRLETPLSELRGKDVFQVINGNAMTYLYFRNPERGGDAGWTERPAYEQLRGYRKSAGAAPVDLIAAVAEFPGIELVVSRRSATEVEVRAGKAVAVIRGHGLPGARSGLSVQPESGDPLGLQERPETMALLDGRPHGADEWLMATAGSRYPDCVYRLYQLLTQPGCGDLVVTAEIGYDLGLDYELFVRNYRGGHGGLRADQMRVPYVLAGPGVPADCRVSVARAEDVGATLFHLLGLPTAGLDGRPLGDVVALAGAPPPATPAGSRGRFLRHAGGGGSR